MSSLASASVPNAAARGFAGRTTLLYLIMLASGCAGLGYEIVWTRMLAVALGHEIGAVLAVLCAFFAGLALGALLLGDRIRQSDRPVAWYAALELVIAGWSALLILLFPVFNQWLPNWLGLATTPLLHWSTAFLATLVLLGPATLAMGATLPAMQRLFEQRYGLTQHVAGLYATNTAGAVLGILLSSWLLIPTFGYSTTLAIFAALNGICALLVLAAPRTTPCGANALRSASSASSRTHESRWNLPRLFATGLLGIGFEVLVVRVLSQVFEDTVYTFAAVLSVYLLGSATGAALYHARFRNGPSVRQLRWLLALTSLACLTGMAFLWGALGLYDRLLVAAGGGMRGSLIAELSLAALVFALPTLAMGALCSCQLLLAAPVSGLGRALAANTLGAALAPALAGVWLLPLLGAKSALFTVAGGYLLLLLLTSERSLERWSGNRYQGRLLSCSVAALILSGLMLAPPLQLLRVPVGGSVLAYSDGIAASLAVVEDVEGVRFLKVNNHFSMGSTSSGYADHRQTHLPLLLHPAPESALFLGVGTGMSLAAARVHRNVKVTAAELLPESLGLMHWFGTDPEQSNWPTAPQLVAADARRFVRASKDHYDVIIADLFHPARSGAAVLFTREHFQAVRDRLSEGGLFCQWLPLFQMDRETFELIARAFAQAFPHAHVYMPHFSLRQPIVGLIGTKQSRSYEAGYLAQRVQDPLLAKALQTVNIDSDPELLGGFIAGRSALMTATGSGPVNTDNWPGVAFRAPAFAYRQQGQHGERLVALVQDLRRAQGGTAAIKTDSKVFSTRLERYWEARDRYLEAGLSVKPHSDPKVMLQQVGRPLLEIVGISDEFMPAYRPLLSLGEQLYRQDPDLGTALLMTLQNQAPLRQAPLRLLAALKEAAPATKVP